MYLHHRCWEEPLQKNENIGKLDCSTCITEKKIILRDNLAKANHYARIYAGYIIRREFPPENIRNPEIRRDVIRLRPIESRSRILTLLTAASVQPLPAGYFMPCAHEDVKLTQ
jgi:hypothetical protein